MRILVDADACPVLNIIEDVASEYGIELCIYSDITHDLEVGYGKIIKLDRGDQAVDMAILNNCAEGDIIITGDYGLASLVLNRGALALSFSGRVFNEKNIEYLLMKRHINAKIRRGGGRHKGPSKRTKEDDDHFRERLLKIIKENSENNENEL